MHKILIIEIIFILTIFPTNCAKYSGFYIDNGFNSTISIKVTDDKEKEDIEDILLNIFNLPNKPKGIRRSLIVKKSAPTFLLNIYKNILTSDIDELNQKNIEELNLSNNIINIIDQSDLIMTVSAHSSHSFNPLKIHRSRRIWFDVSEISKKENFMTAELRLYRDLSKNIDIKPNEAYNITIYRLGREQDGKRIKHYVNSVKIAINKGGWISLNISQALEHWIKFPEENEGLFFAIYFDDQSLVCIKPGDIGIVSVSAIPNNKQPFIVVFFKRFAFTIDHTNTRTYEILSKIKRSIEFEKQYHNQNNSHIPIGNMCKIKSLYVSFNDFRWHDWIIAPIGYNAYYCSGKCSFPTTVNITTHAIIQSMVHVKKPDEIPNPYCVPTKMSPISVLLFVDNNNIVLKKFQNMIVDSCGCQ